METRKKQEGVKYTTPFGIASYPALFTPAKKFKSETEKEYTVIILFKKGEDLKSFKTACDQALSEYYGNDKTKWPKEIIYPFVDQGIDKEDLENKGKAHDHLTVGAVKVRFKTQEKFGAPIVLGQAREEVLDPTEVYGGRHMRVGCNIKVNPVVGTKKTYVTPYLVTVQLGAKGERLGGGNSIDPGSFFEPVTFDDEDSHSILG